MIKMSGGTAFRRRTLLMSVGAMAFLASSAAVAQPSPSGDPGAAAQTGGTALDEVIVTARRKEENLQNVPVSVTAYSGDKLEEHGIVSVMDIGKIAPSTVITPSPRGLNTPSFVIRGQRTIDTSAVIDPVVVTYVNEMAFMRPQGLNAALFDIQSVQVLRGPQGTLFGRNTTGGAVLINTNTPTDEFEGRIAGTFGNYALKRGEGMLNIPLGDKAAFRLAGIISKRDGYMINRATGYDQNNENYFSYRATIQLKPTDRLTSTTYFNQLQDGNHGSANQIWASTRADLQADIAANKARPFTYGSNFIGSESTKTWDVTNVTTYEINDSLTLKNIAGYRDVHTLSVWDLDGSSVFVQQFYGETQTHQLSEELQLQGKHDQIDWILGAFYFMEDGTDIAYGFQAATPTTPRPSGVSVTNKSYSVFGQGTYRIPFVDGLSFTAGARFTRDERENTAIQKIGTTCNITLISGQRVCFLSSEKNFEKPSWTVGLNYQVTPDLLVYFAHRHGYRSGGLQSRITSEAANIPYNAEKVNDVELGIKTDFSVNGLQGRFNGDVFLARYSGTPRQVSFVGGGGTLVSGIFNAASTAIKGAEAELTLIPVEGLELSGGFGWVDPVYRKYTTGGVDISHTPFGYIPTWTVNADIRYTLPLDEQVGKVSALVSYRSQSEIYIADVPVLFGEYLPGYDVFNARVDWDNIFDTNVSVAGFVNNFTNEAYFPFGTNLAVINFVTRQVAPPRMWGFQLSYKF